MNNSIYNQLTANLELLKLSQMKRHLDEIRDFVTNNGLSFTEGLLKLSNYEVDFKEQSASRSMIKATAFPFVKELKDFDFQKLFDMKGMGIGKINAIIKKYDEAIGENNSQLFNTRSRILFDEINPEIYDVSIEIIGILGISSKWISILKNTGYITVGQLEKIDINLLSKIVGMRNIDKFRKMESKLKLPLIKLCGYVFDKNKEEKDYLMALERSFGFTLQEIADERGVTRERIRQITKKYFDCAVETA